MSNGTDVDDTVFKCWEVNMLLFSWLLKSLEKARQRVGEKDRTETLQVFYVITPWKRKATRKHTQQASHYY